MTKEETVKTEKSTGKVRAFMNRNKKKFITGTAITGGVVVFAILTAKFMGGKDVSIDLISLDIADAINETIS